MSEICICLRRTLDWQDVALVEARLLPRFRPHYALWNATFTLPYHAFRQRLKEIAALNLSRVEGARVVPRDALPARALVVPVDDDDWFAPELAERLESALEPGLAGYSWIRNTLGVRLVERTLTGWLRARRPQRLGPEARQGRHVCGTNNYAVQCPEPRPLLIDKHMQADAYFKANPSLVRRLPLTLSLQNRNLSSQTSLNWRRQVISREDLLRMRGVYRRLYARVRFAEGMAWAAPYVALVAELTDELRVRS